MAKSGSCTSIPKLTQRVDVQVEEVNEDLDEEPTAAGVTGGEGPWNQWKHCGNIEGTGSIFLRCFHQTQLDYIWNVTTTCT